jgi:hypothetical protein
MARWPIFDRCCVLAPLCAQHTAVAASLLHSTLDRLSGPLRGRCLIGAALLASPLVSGFDNAIYQWQQGERRLTQATSERLPLLQRIIDTLVVELRKRLGGRFTAEELAELYGRGTSWCLQLVIDIAPEDPWAWDSAVVIDAAFARYLREAVDYAGGRLVVADG